MAYIDRDKLIENKFKNDISYNAFVSLVKRQPTADVVEVVRCKDCKHREQYDCNNIMLDGTKCGVTDDWFCADGERKETEDE